MNKDIINVFNSSGIVLIPTDTVYGISGDAMDVKAINKVYELKRRDKNKPLIVLVSDYEMLKKYVSSVSSLDEEFIRKYWPGALTIIFKNYSFPKELTGGADTVGIRCPNNEFLLSLIKEYGKPIFSTSANISGEDVIHSVDNFDIDVLDGFDYVVDKGYIEGVASTIVSTLDGRIKILRDGELTKKIKKEF